MGGELFLAAIGGCFMSNLLAAIDARHAEVSGVQTEVIATLADSSGAVHRGRTPRLGGMRGP